MDASLALELSLKLLFVIKKIYKAPITYILRNNLTIKTIEKYRKDIKEKRNEIEEHIMENYFTKINKTKDDFIIVTPQTGNTATPQTGNSTNYKNIFKEIRTDIEQLEKPNLFYKFIHHLSLFYLFLTSKYINQETQKQAGFHYLYKLYMSQVEETEIFNGKIFSPVNFLSQENQQTKYKYKEKKYFDYIDSCELIALDAWLHYHYKNYNSKFDDIRSNVFNLKNRVIAQGICALLITKNKALPNVFQVFLHERSEKVLEAPGTIAVAPSGTLEKNETLNLAYTTHTESYIDCILREFCEELVPELHKQIKNDFSLTPREAMKTNNFKFSFMHIGDILDPLTLKIETCCILYVDKPCDPKYKLSENFEGTAVMFEVSLPEEINDNNNTSLYETNTIKDFLGKQKNVMPNTKYILKNVTYSTIKSLEKRAE